MFSPRNLIIAGVVLIAIALGSSGHGLWWLFGLLWVLPHAGGRTRHACGAQRGAAATHGARREPRPDARSPQSSPTRTLADRPRGLSRPLTARR